MTPSVYSKVKRMRVHFLILSKDLFNFFARTKTVSGGYSEPYSDDIIR